MTTKRKHIKRRIKRTMSKNKKGGVLVLNPETDLINTHICNVKPGVEKESPGSEIFTSISKPFELKSETIGYLRQMYKSADDKWFKFTIFNNDGRNYIYIIDGAKINKHSVCMLQGLLDVTKPSGEYNELRNAVNNLQIFKNENGSNMQTMTDEQKSECITLINNINQLIERDVKCMPVVSAGSGSINSDNSICINNKSGHYKPNNFTMSKAKEIFQENTGIIDVFIKEKEDKNVLKEKYGKNYENYSGICI